MDPRSSLELLAYATVGLSHSYYTNPHLQSSEPYRKPPLRGSDYITKMGQAYSQVFPPAAKFTEETLPDQAGKVSLHHSTLEIC